MKFFHQLNGHYPKGGIIGDCYRTAIGCLLDLPPEQVPNFLELETPEGKQVVTSDVMDKRVNEWLAPRGLTKLDIAYPGECKVEEILESIMFANGADILYLLTGKNMTKTPHIVICRGDKMLWNPSDEGQMSEIVAPADDGRYWLTFLMPISMRWSPSPTPLRTESSAC